MTKFLQGSFSVGETPGLDEADQQRRWEQTFGKRADPGVATESKPGTFDTAAARSNATSMTAALNGPDWKLAQRRIEEALAPIRKDIAAGQAENIKLRDDLYCLQQALERILDVTARAEAYAMSGVRDDEAFSDIKAFAQNALALVKGGTP